MANENLSGPDPITELEGLAALMERVAPDVVAAIGTAAVHEDDSPPAAERVGKVTLKIVGLLTSFSEAAEKVRRPSAEEPASAAAELPASAVPEMPRRRPGMPAKPAEKATLQELRLGSERPEEADLGSALEAYLSQISVKSRIHVGEIARELGGLEGLEPARYKELLRLLNSRTGVQYTIEGWYVIDPSRLGAEAESPGQPTHRTHRSRVRRRLENLETESTELPTNTPDPETPPEEPGTQGTDYQSNTEQATPATPEATPDDAPGDEVQDDPSEAAEEEDPRRELVELAARWMGRRANFTLAELRDHLLRNEVIDETIKGPKLLKLLTEIRPDIEEYYEARGERILWLDGPMANGRKTYIMAFREKPRKPVSSSDTPEEKPAPSDNTDRSDAEAMPQDGAATEMPESLTQEDKDRPVQEQELEEAVAVIQHNGGAVTTKQAVELVAEALNITTDHAQKVLDAAVDLERLDRKGVQGRRGYAVPAEATIDTEEDSDEDYDDTILDHAERYIDAIHPVMAVLAGLNKPTDRIEPKALWVAAGLENTMDFRDFKSCIMQMSKDGLVTVLRDVRLHTKTKSSQILKGRAVKVADSDVWRAWKRDFDGCLEMAKAHALNRILDNAKSPGQRPA